MEAVVVVKTVFGHRWAGTVFVVLDWRRWTAQVLGCLAIELPRAGQIDGSNPPRHHRLAARPSLEAILALDRPGGRTHRRRDRRDGVVATDDGGVVAHRCQPRRDDGVGHRRPVSLGSQPHLLGDDATAIGLTVPASAVDTFVGTLAMVTFIEWQVRVVEEPYLVHGHGRDYVLWSVKTGRFVPCVGCFHENPII